MMNRGELEFIADTLLIHKLALIEFGMHKTAGFGDVILGALDDGLDVIKKSVAGLVDTSSPSSIVESIGEIIVSGALFRMWWPLSFINEVAKMFGLDVVSIGKKIWGMISGTLLSEGSVSPQEVSSATKAVAMSLAGSDGDLGEVKDSRAYDLFEPIRIADQQGKLYSFARQGRRVGGHFGFFNSIPRSKSKSIIAGLVGWFIKSALLGAGVLTVSGVAQRLLGVKKDGPEEQAKSEHSGPTVPAAAEMEAPQGASMTPTGRGQDIHPNDHKKSQWVVPLVQNSVEATLIAWAMDVYKEMAGQEQAIRQSPYFNRVVSEFKRYMEYGNTSRVPVPPNYKSRKQVVDQFAGDVASKLSSLPEA